METTGTAASPLKLKLSATMASLEQNQASLCETGQCSTTDDESVLWNILKKLNQSLTLTGLIQTILRHFAAVKYKILTIIPCWKFPRSYHKVLAREKTNKGHVLFSFL